MTTRPTIITIKRKRYGGVPVPPIVRRPPMPAAPLSDETKRKLLIVEVLRSNS